MLLKQVSFIIDCVSYAIICVSCAKILNQRYFCGIVFLKRKGYCGILSKYNYQAFCQEESNL